MSLNNFEDFVIENKVIGFFDEPITLKAVAKATFTLTGENQPTTHFSSISYLTTFPIIYTTLT